MNNYFDIIKQLQQAIELCTRENVELREQIIMMETQQDPQKNLKISNLQKMIIQQQQQISELKQSMQKRNQLKKDNYCNEDDKFIIEQMKKKFEEKSNELKRYQELYEKSRQNLKKTQQQVLELKEQINQQCQLNAQEQQKVTKMELLIKNARQQEFKQRDQTHKYNNQNKNKKAYLEQVIEMIIIVQNYSLNKLRYKQQIENYNSLFSFNQLIYLFLINQNMITLIWLVHFDKRWLCFNCPIIQSMWLFGTIYCFLLAAIDLYSIYFHQLCPYAFKHLLINIFILLILAGFSYIIYAKTLFKQEKMQKYQNRQDIAIRLNHWTIRKVLLSKIGFAVFVIGFIQNIWALETFLHLQECKNCEGMQPNILKLNLLLTIIASIPIAFMIICYVLIKSVALITSSLFPHTYIKIKKIFCN
ncbi:unnamed protein product [Paramecium primaurelia]|uniref:Transmembrane protein n=1 Tax=Paramecium primaurelia TaxID=5886 RepID=A0A8S1LJA4_PARPR|nr:unnamed protein product [Paramecium primaurelia]CAD8066174.1 unnamed protein product [Paramecium primaurelia]